MSLRIVPYDAARHGAFVHGTMLACLADQWPWNLVETERLKDSINIAIGNRATLTMVAEVDGVDDAFAGWLSVNGANVVFAYTRHAYRRRFKCMTTLLSAVGADPWARDTGVLFWTRAAERIHLAKGWPIYWKVTE